MSLTVVSTPIGHPDDITLRALNILKSADVIICEETRPAQTFLKHHGIQSAANIDKRQGEVIPLYELNEHSQVKDLPPLVNLCKTQNVALISDCGTPGFCDPGAGLVALCRSQSISVTAAPGASSLMAFIAQCGERLDTFLFAGFLPTEKVLRTKRLQRLLAANNPVLLMDTPYRLKQTIADIAAWAPQTLVTVGLNLTAPGELLVKGRVSELINKDWPKAPFVLLIHKEAGPNVGLEKSTELRQTSFAQRKPERRPKPSRPRRS